MAGAAAPSSSLALLTNPAAGSGESRRVADLLRAEVSAVRVFEVGQVGEAVAWRPSRIVVAGGDGSIAPAAEAAAGAGVPLAVVPVGTANDFARALDLPGDLGAACRLAGRGDRLRRLDLGRMGDRPFVNVASAGLPPAAAREARGLKGALGALAYPVGALRAGLSAEPFHCAVSCDGEDTFSGRAWQLTVALTGAFGGGASIEADPADGALDLAVIEAGSRTRLIRHALEMRRGRVSGQRGVQTRRCHSAHLTVAEATRFNVDGEVVRSGPVDLFVEAGAFNLVVG